MVDYILQVYKFDQWFNIAFHKKQEEANRDARDFYRKGFKARVVKREVKTDVFIQYG